MSDSNTISEIEQCLARLAAGNQTDEVWNELFSHVFNRLLDQCERIIGRELARPNPLITKNTVLAETFLRLRKAMESEAVTPRTAREFFGLSSRNIRWQILDMLRKPAPQQEGQLHEPRASGNVLDDVEVDEKWQRFWELVESLPNDEREVFDLLWTQSLKQREVAEVLGCSRDQVNEVWKKVRAKILDTCELPQVAFRRPSSDDG